MGANGILGGCRGGAQSQLGPTLYTNQTETPVLSARAISCVNFEGVQSKSALLYLDVLSWCLWGWLLGNRKYIVGSAEIHLVYLSRVVLAC